MLSGCFVSTGSMLINIFDGEYLTGRCDLAAFIVCLTSHEKWSAQELSSHNSVRGAREAPHANTWQTTGVKHHRTGLEQQRDLCSPSWGWTGGGEPRWRSPWTSSRWSSPYLRWPPATGARGTGKLSSPFVPDRWPSNKRTALDITAQISTTAGLFSIFGRPARISLFWGSSTPASGSPASRTSTLSVRMRFFFLSFRQTAKNVSLTFPLSYENVVSKCF